jgi:hypothetical protein
MWNRPPDLKPLPHFQKHDSRNLTAARARLAELLRKEAAERRMVMPTEELPSWSRFDPRCLAVCNVTDELCGDPSPRGRASRTRLPL